MSYPVLARRDTALDDAETVALLRDRLGDGVVDDVAEYGELTVVVAPTAWHDAVATCRDDDRFAFDLFDCLFGVDAGEDGLDVVAVLYSTSKGRRVMLRSRCEGGREAPSMPTVSDLYAGANWHEREAFDMFGIDFPDHPGLLPRILCVENFEGWPLRKEFPLASRVAKPWPGVKDPAEPDEDGNVVVREPAIGEAPGPSGLDEIIARQAREANPTPRDEAGDEVDGGVGRAATDGEPVREEVELDQEVYDQLIADGKSERIARSKAKASFIKKQRAAERTAATVEGDADADSPSEGAPASPDGEVGGATQGETADEAAPVPSTPDTEAASPADGADGAPGDDDAVDGDGDGDGGDGGDEAQAAAATAEAARADQVAAREARAAEEAEAVDQHDEVDPIPAAAPPSDEPSDDPAEAPGESDGPEAPGGTDGPEAPGGTDEAAGSDEDVDGVPEASNDSDEAVEAVEAVDTTDDLGAEPVASEQPDFDDDGPEVPEPGPFGAGSAHPRADGSGPDGWRIKATTDGSVFHTPDSPNWRAAEADVWFQDAEAAQAAGFEHWDPYVRTDLDAPDGPAVADAVAEDAPDDLDGPYGPGSAPPAEDGSGPDGWTVKGNGNSMLFHTVESPSYEPTRAEVWFASDEAARAAGFRHWDPDQRRSDSDPDDEQGGGA